MKKSKKLMLIVATLALVPAVLGDIAFAAKDSDTGEKRSGVSKGQIACNQKVKQVKQDHSQSSAADSSGSKEQAVR